MVSWLPQRNGFLQPRRKERIMGYLFICGVCNRKYEKYCKGWNYCPHCQREDMLFKEANLSKEKRPMRARWNVGKRK